MFPLSHMEVNHTCKIHFHVRRMYQYTSSCVPPHAWYIVFLIMCISIFSHAIIRVVPRTVQAHILYGYYISVPLLQANASKLRHSCQNGVMKNSGYSFGHSFSDLARSLTNTSPLFALLIADDMIISCLPLIVTQKKKKKIFILACEDPNCIFH